MRRDCVAVSGDKACARDMRTCTQLNYNQIRRVNCRDTRVTCRLSNAGALGVAWQSEDGRALSERARRLAVA